MEWQEQAHSHGQQVQQVTWLVCPGGWHGIAFGRVCSSWCKVIIRVVHVSGPVSTHLMVRLRPALLLRDIIGLRRAAAVAII